MQANSQLDYSDLTALQKATLGLNILSLVEIVLQFVIMMKENCQLQEKRNSVNVNETQYDPMTEEDRRLTYAKANRNYGLSYSLSFSILMILGGLFLSARICPMNFGIDETGVLCNYCNDDNCIECYSNYTYCDTCDVNYFSDD
jgi:hypothetical protein